MAQAEVVRQFPEARRSVAATMGPIPNQRSLNEVNALIPSNMTLDGAGICFSGAPPQTLNQGFVKAAPQALDGRSVFGR